MFNPFMRRLRRFASRVLALKSSLPRRGQLGSVGRQGEARGHWVKMTGELRLRLEMETLKQRPGVHKDWKMVCEEYMGPPGWPSGKEFASQCRRCRRHRLDP